MTTFLGLDKEGWEIINAVATCLGVIATFTAVLVSLWLASRPDRLNLTGRAGIRVLLTPGEPGRPELLMMEIVNRGRRPAKITGIGWEFGARRSRRKHFVQQIDRHDRMSSALPIILDDGAEARWYHPLRHGLQGWTCLRPVRNTPTSSTCTSCSRHQSGGNTGSRLSLLCLDGCNQFGRRRDQCPPKMRPDDRNTHNVQPLPSGQERRAPAQALRRALAAC